MSTSNTETRYVKVKDMAGNDFVCPLDALKDPHSITEDELDHCIEDAVVGRYAGQLSMADNPR